MRRLVLRVVLGLSLCLSALGPAHAQQDWDKHEPEEKKAAPNVGAVTNDPYSRAMALKQKGRYSEAMPLLEAMARVGHGFEIAQVELGKCYFDLAAKDKTPEGASKSRTLGFAWILNAAESRSAAAEEEMVRLYLDGTGTPVDRIEAGKWYLLWRRSPARMQLGNVRFDTGLENRLKAALPDAEWPEAQRRADSWQPA